MKEISPNNRKLVWKNVADLLRRRRDVRIQRVGEAWRKKFPKGAAWRALQSANVRLCLETDSPTVGIRWKNRFFWEGFDVIGEVFCGGKPVGTFSRNPARKKREDVFACPSGGVRLWEIHFPWCAEAVVEAVLVDEKARLFDVECPCQRLMFCYGSSITQGFNATSATRTWPHVAACKLGLDFFNLGFGGAAFYEKVVAEYIASRGDWDYLTVESGTNTGGGYESAASFRNTFTTFLDTVRKRHPDKPILCFTSTLYTDMDGENRNVRNPAGSTFEEYREVVREIVAKRRQGDKNLFLAEGLDWVGTKEFLSDQIHPNDEGMKRIGLGVSASWKASGVLRNK